MLLYSYNFSVTFQRKYSSYCMKSLKTNPTKWYSDMSSDVLFLFFFFLRKKKKEESIRANDMLRKNQPAD